MEGSLIESMFKAIIVGDESALAQCLERATIETVLQFEASYEVSPLHLCVTLGGRNHLGLMRQLLASGLVDATQRDSNGSTVLECAHATGDLGLVEELIKIQVQGVDDATACYEMMRHRSLELFKIFLSLRKETDEANTFQSIASALMKMNVKNFPLPGDLRVFLFWKLSDFGYRHLVGDWPGPNDPCEWRGQMDIFDDCWRAIQGYDTRMYNDIDDQLLHRLHVVHNQLYFLKNFPFLDHLPLMEAVFCLAIFLSIFENSRDFEEYRLLVNKCQIMEFLRMIGRQLALARNCMDQLSPKLIEIMTELGLCPNSNDPLAELWEKVQTMSLGESDNWMKGKVKDFEKLKSTTGEEHAAIRSKLIKDIQTKIKQLNKSANKAGNNDSQQVNPQVDVAKKLKAEIYKSLPYLGSPENVANKLLAEVKKNKPLEVVVADAIAAEVIDLGHLVRGKDRLIIRRVKKCYTKTRQMYSINKIMRYGKLLYLQDFTNMAVGVDSFKRYMQVLGEAVKNTQNSPNMSGKVERTITEMLSLSFLVMNKTLREMLSHSMTLARTLVREDMEWRVFKQMIMNFQVVLVTFFLLFVVTVEETRLSLYGQMYRCQSAEQLRSLLVYVGKAKNLNETQDDCFNAVKGYFEEANNLLKELRTHAVANTAQFKFTVATFKKRCFLVEEFERILENEAEQGLVRLRKVSFANEDLHTVRRQLDWIFTLRCPLNFCERIRASWGQLATDVYFICQFDRRLNTLDAGTIIEIPNILMASIRSIEEDDYVRQTRELAKTVGGVDDETQVNKLHELLKRYYNNIFALDLKRKILEDFFDVKKNKKHNDEKAAAIELIIKDDQHHLQILYDKRRSRLRSILEQNGICSVESLKRTSSIKPIAVPAIEYLQLELTEMLTAAGYFGNSFHYVMHRLPMIQGKNYRNYLAHDGISYDLLSDTNREKILINAFVIANTEVRLFDRRVKPIGEGMRFPTVDDTHRWLAEQNQVMVAVRTTDVSQIHAKLRAGGELRSHFCFSPNPLHHESEYRPLTQFCNPCDPGPWITDLMNRYYETFGEEVQDPLNVFQVALVRRDFNEAFKRMLKLEVIRHEIYEWDAFVSRLRPTELFSRLISKTYRYEELEQLIQHGNVQGVRDLLLSFSGDLPSDERQNPLDVAIMVGVRPIIELLLARTPSPHPKTLQTAIITHLPMDLLHSLMPKCDLCPGSLQIMLATAIRAKHQLAFSYLLEQEQMQQHIHTALGECFEMAATTVGQHGILQILLANYPSTDLRDLSRILYQAARKRHWQSVRLLLDFGVTADVLPLLVRHGQSRLLRWLKSVDRDMCGTTNAHPLAMAVRHGVDTERMVRTLKRLGFDWLDSSTVLHEKIKRCDSQSLQQTWAELDEQRLKRSSHVVCTDRVSVTLNVLQHWMMIAYVEQLVSGRTSLICALDIKTSPTVLHRNTSEAANIQQAKDRLKLLSCLEDAEPMKHEIDQLRAYVRRGEMSEEERRYNLVRTLLDRCRTSRKIAGFGVLGGIVFRQAAGTVRLDKEHEDKSVNVQNCCADMMARLESLTSVDLGGSWREVTIEVGVPVTFNVFPASDDKPIAPTPDVSCTLAATESLPDRLAHLQTIAQAMFSEYAVVFAQVATQGETLYYWQIEDMCCVYNVFPEGSDIDLTDFVDRRDGQERIALHWCLTHTSANKGPEHEFQHQLARLLLENGSNPMLADKDGVVPLIWAMSFSTHRAIAHDAIEECLRRDLRSANGATVLELVEEPTKNRLIHNALLNARFDIVRHLLHLGVKANVANALGSTPAHLATQITVEKSAALLKQLLDYDRSLVNEKDVLGRTVLHCAAEVNSTELLDLIMKYEPDLSATTSDGRSALTIARQSKYVEWAERFTSYMNSDERAVGQFSGEIIPDSSCA